VNGKLILRLSMFGLAMAVATVFIVPQRAEAFLWLPIFAYCAYVIAKQVPERPFVHGLLLGVANSMWITAVHVLLFDAYLARHPGEAGMMESMKMPAPRLVMAVVGPCIGVATGIVIGLFSLAARWILRRRSEAAAS
jgi:uncharacterized membrane protein